MSRHNSDLAAHRHNPPSALGHPAPTGRNETMTKNESTICICLLPSQYKAFKAAGLIENTADGEFINRKVIWWLGAGHVRVIQQPLRIGEKL
jgi:hypothetical protein